MRLSSGKRVSFYSVLIYRVYCLYRVHLNSLPGAGYRESWCSGVIPAVQTDKNSCGLFLCYWAWRFFHQIPVGQLGGLSMQECQALREAIVQFLTELKKAVSKFSGEHLSTRASRREALNSGGLEYVGTSAIVWPFDDSVFLARLETVLLSGRNCRIYHHSIKSQLFGRGLEHVYFIAPGIVGDWVRRRRLLILNLDSPAESTASDIGVSFLQALGLKDVSKFQVHGSSFPEYLAEALCP